MITTLVLGVALFPGPSVATHVGPHVSISGESQPEGGDITFTVTLSDRDPLDTSTITVDYATVNGTAVAPDDYASTSGTLSFIPTDNSETVVVQTTNDDLDEAAETFSVALSNPTSGVEPTTASATGTITDNDGPPTATISNGSPSPVTEGGSTTFTITLSGPSGQDATVNYSVVNGGTVAGDFTGSTSGSVTFTSGDTSEPIAISTNDDLIDESDESFSVSLTGTSTASVASDESGTATIADNDPEPALSISNVTQAEGNAGTTTFIFTVSLTPASAKTVTVNFATRNGTAIADGLASANDYGATSGSRTFNPGEISKTIPVTVNGDTFSEGTENFFVDLSGATNASLPQTPFGTGTITNDDAQPSLSVEDKTVSEGVGTAAFTVTLAPSSGQTVQVNYEINDGSATTPADYGDSSNLLSFGPGETTKTIFVPIVQDALDEPNETFTIALSNESNATVSPDERNSVETIADDDAAPTVSIANAPAVTEGAVASFPVTLSAPSGQAVTVSYATTHGTTSAGDFSTPPPLSGTVTIPAGLSSGSISLQTNDDLIDEADQESFTVTLSSPSGATLGSPASGTGAINDNDVLPTVTIANAAAVAEGANATFTVTLSPASGRQVTVAYGLGHGTTNAADVTGATSGTVTFSPGETSKPITVATVNDADDEDDQETFTVTLSAPTNATVGTPSSGTGTITDNDNPPTVTIGNAPSVAEGGPASFPVTLSAASGRTVTVSYAASHGTTNAADLGAPLGGSVTFAPGDPLTKQLTIPTVDDTQDEADQETFTVTLSAPTNAALGTTVTGTGTINDNDALPTVSIANAPAVAEGGTASFAVTLAAASGRTVTVNYSTAHGTTTAADLSGALSGTVTFVPGDPLTKQVPIATVDDALDEADIETFTVTLATTPTSNATLGTPSSATGTVTDNDAPPSLTITDRSALEGNSGGLGTCGPVPAPGTTPAGFAPFTVTLSAPSGQAVTVQWSTANNTAVAPQDYAAVSATTLTFAPGGALSQTVCVKINGDVSDEPNETFSVVLTNATNATLADAVGVGTILDDDGEPALTVTGASDPESGAARFVVSLLPSSGNVVTVDLLTVGGTAVAGADFASIPAGVSPGPPASCSANPCTLTFNAGQSSKAIDVNLVNDTLDEDNEAFTVRLSNEQNAKVLNGNDRIGFVTILDDDGPPSVSIGDATVTEGNSETVNANFQVTLSAVSGRTISVDYTAVNGSAVSPDDYVASSGTISFAPGETSKNAVVPVNGESSFEGDETFAVSLSSPVNVAIGDGEGIGTIINDDTPPQPPPPPPPPPPGPPPPDGGSGTTTTPTGSGPTTTSPTTTRPPTTGQGPPTPQTFTGMGISGAPVTLLDNFAAIGVTCSKKAKGTCVGKLEIIARGAGRRKGRALAIVNGQVKRVTTGAVTYGREAFAIPRGRTEKVLVGLSRRGVRAVRQRGRLLVTVVATAKDSAGKRAKPVRRSLWLQAPRTVRKLPAPK